jgi:hypothetical protein
MGLGVVVRAVNIPIFYSVKHPLHLDLNIYLKRTTQSFET